MAAGGGDMPFSIFPHPNKIPSDDEVAWTMKYKADLGVEVVTRKQFLAMWTADRDRPVPILGSELCFDPATILN
jgi:hypothetical protein